MQYSSFVTGPNQGQSLDSLGMREMIIDHIDSGLRNFVHRLKSNRSR